MLENHTNWMSGTQSAFKNCIWSLLPR